MNNDKVQDITDNSDDLWKAVISTVRPLGEKGPLKKKKVVISAQKRLSVPLKSLNHDVLPDFKNYPPLVEGGIDNLDSKTGLKFKKGKMEIEGTLDLHGHTLETGFEALKNFIAWQRKSHHRCVLVITGRGGYMGRGVIKNAFPSWINHPEIRSFVLSFSIAASKDGGDGAYYVLLKRDRGN